MKRCVICLLIFAMLFCLACSGDEEAGIVDIIDINMPTMEPVETPGFQLAMHKNSGNGMTAAGLYHSIAMRSDGTVVATGQNTVGQCNVNDWQDMVFIAARGELSMGVTRQGGVKATGLMESNMSNALAWTGIRMLAIGEAHVVGLKEDGTVVAAGDSSRGQCEVSGWRNVVAVAAAGSHTVGLMADGSILVAGDLGAPNWSNITAIYTNAQAIFGMDAAGKIYTTGDYQASAWSNMEKLAVGENIVLGLREDGSVLCLAGELDVSAVMGAADISVGDGHALITLVDGSVQGLGGNAVYQCETGGWQVYPYEQDGYLLGFAAGSTAESVAAILEDLYGLAVVKLRSDNMELAPADPVPTGAEALAGDTMLGIIVIRGEVTGDGIVDTADYSAINDHITGTRNLEGAYLEAARIYENPSGTIMSYSSEAIRQYVEEGKAITQFRVSSHVYDADIASAQEVSPDVSGYIRIPGTNIDYPIMKATADYKYNDYNWKGEKSESASLYTYYNEKRQGRFYAITAHNSRTSGTMFHFLHHIYDYNIGKDKCQYSRCSNESKLTDSLPDLKNYAERVWRINVNGEEGLWEVYAVYEVKADKKLETLYDNIWYFDGDIGWSNSLDTLYTSRILTDTEIRAWIDKQIERSEINLGVTVQTSDDLLTILTCATTSSEANAGGRLYYFLHRVG